MHYHVEMVYQTGLRALVRDDNNPAGYATWDNEQAVFPGAAAIRQALGPKQAEQIVEMVRRPCQQVACVEDPAGVNPAHPPKYVVPEESQGTPYLRHYHLVRRKTPGKPLQPVRGRRAGVTGALTFQHMFQNVEHSHTMPGVWSMEDVPHYLWCNASEPAHLRKLALDGVRVDDKSPYAHSHAPTDDPQATDTIDQLCEWIDPQKLHLWGNPGQVEVLSMDNKSLDELLEEIYG